MIFADKLIALRKQNGWSQEELAEKLNVSRQSISKWEGAQSVPDLDKIIALSGVFGVSTDYLLRDDIQMATPSDHYEPMDMITVSMEEANDFLSKSKRASYLNAIGVSLCVLSPTTLLYVSGLAGEGNINPSVGTAIGIVMLLVVIALAIAIFIYSSSTLEEYEFLNTEEFKIGYGVQGLAQDVLKRTKRSNVIAVTIGVVLCVLCPAPLIIFSLMDASSLTIVVMTDVLLAMVAAAVFLFISFSGERSASHKLLQQGEYTRDEKYVSKRMNVVAGIYWPLITAIYLAFSFVTYRWDISWIIWPVAGVFFAVIAMIAKSIILSKRDRVS